MLGRHAYSLHSFNIWFLQLSNQGRQNIQTKIETWQGPAQESEKGISCHQGDFPDEVRLEGGLEKGLVPDQLARKLESFQEGDLSQAEAMTRAA